MEKIVQDSIPSVVFITENKFNSKMHIYRTLRNDPTFMSSSVILQNFYNSTASASKSIISNAEDNLANGNTTSAQTAIAGLNAQNNIEQNHKNVLNAGINHSNNVFVAADSASIVSLANGCPFTDGIAVYQARALYNEVYNAAELFYDNCQTQSSSRIANNNASTTVDTKQNSSTSYLLYPNPAKDQIFISCSNSESNILPIRVFDITGKLITFIKVNLNRGVGNFDLDAENGIYFVKIGENENQTIKLVIQK